MSAILFLYFSFIHGAIGVFLTFDNPLQYGSKIFIGMNNLLPMRVWGILLLISSIMFILASFQEGRKQYTCMVISGFIGAIVFILMTMASLELVAGEQTNTVNYAIISSIDLVIAMVGGISLWIQKT